VAPAVGWSPLYQELTRVPLIVQAPGLTPGYRQALTTAPDLAPTVLELAGIEHPSVMQGESFLDVLVGSKEEHRSFVLSSWPLYFAEGEITTAVDFRPRRISSYMPITITTRDRSVILGGPEDPPEFYDLTEDSRERKGERVGAPRGRGQILVRGCDLLPRRTGGAGRPPGAEAQGRRGLRAGPISLQENRAVPGMAWASSW
jgi:hypothetical protein